MKIQINVKHNENFTASSLMGRYAKENNLQCVNEYFTTYIKINGELWSYDHWQITPCEDAPEYDTVTLYLTTSENKYPLGY